MIELKNVSKYYYKKGIIANGITRVNLKFDVGEFVAITGESGSGKSTLLNVISGLDSYEEGEMYINDLETSHYREKDFEEYRRQYIGNIFQSFNLVNSYNVYQNIELVLLLNGYSSTDVKEKVLQLIEKVGLTKFINTKVSKLSGGQKQRVAIARALAKETAIIIADEPTGNLDSKAAKEIIELLHDISKDKLVIIVTHNYEQVEKYVTRKIKMHDGKVLEDKKIQEFKVVKNVKEADIQNIRFISELKLGIRNAFNIIPKFVLLLIVFLFILLAVMGEYGSFKEMEYQSSKDGYNYLFGDLSDKRIILKKSDGSPISDADYLELEKNSNIDYIIKNDYMIDNEFTLTDDNKFYLNGHFQNVSNFIGNVDYGRLPENDNEVIIAGQRYDYYLSTMQEDLMTIDFHISMDYLTDSNLKLKIVGIKYFDKENNKSNTTIYGSDVLESEIINLTNRMLGNTSVVFESNPHELNIVVNDNVPQGMVYIPEYMIYSCPNTRCLNQNLIITNRTIYYENSINLKVKNVFTTKNIKKMLGLTNYDEYSNSIFINSKDYNKVYIQDIYQSSVYLKSVKDTNKTIQKLHDLGYTTLLIKDTLVQDEISGIVVIFKTVVTIILLIALFFISYFIIKLILKSRNVYYATIRMIGATKSVARNLLIIDLFTVSNIAYLAVIVLVLLSRYNIFTIKYFKNILEFLSIGDYVLLYVIIVVISYLISSRYARKLFKNSTMMTYREEV